MLVLDLFGKWIPAFAGMTNIGVIMTFFLNNHYWVLQIIKPTN